MVTLRELNLTNNALRNLPYEIGKLFRLQNLGNLTMMFDRNIIKFVIYLIGLLGNPLPIEILTIYAESNGLQKLLTYFLDNFSTSLSGI